MAAAVARPFQQPVAVVWLSHAAGAAVPPPLHVAVAMFPDPGDSEAAALLLDVDSSLLRLCIRLGHLSGACSRVGPPEALVAAGSARGCGPPSWGPI